MGEAAGRVSEEERGLYPTIQWTQIISLRNRLIHGYDAVDNDIIWQIIVHDLSWLTKVLDAILT